MYRMIGADGREYGPITAEQLRQWIQQNRANAQTRVLPEGAAEWTTLGALPEFAADFLQPVALPPTVQAAATEEWSRLILARDYHLDASACISRGWKLVMADFWLLVGASVVIGLVITAGSSIPYLGILVSLAISGPMMGGLYSLFLKKIRGQPAEFGDAFSKCNAAFFVPLMLVYLVSTLLTMAGFMLCVLPGIYLMVSYMFALPLVMDKKMEFWPAMELSRKVVGKHWWVVFGLLLLCVLVTIGGFLVCCIGIFIAAAIVQAAWMYAYEDIFSDRA